MHPELVTSIPGPESLHLAHDLREHECRNTTFTSPEWPVFWDRAEGCNVWDVDGNRFLDLTSAFGVAGLGHTHPSIVRAMQEQSTQLLHGMGDVHPTALKSELCRELSEVTWGRWNSENAKVILSNSGFESVETALKTAVIATGKNGVLAFKNAYHGLGYGALIGTGLDDFRTPFDGQIAPIRQQLSYPRRAEDLATLQNELKASAPNTIGALIVEPIQGRGGKIIPPTGFLKILREWCDNHNVCLIFDEIYSGFRRTGKMFACEWENVTPDMICIGKALSGGYPISACVGSSKVMDAWPKSTGEAIHTSTFLGNPVGCAMALASLDLLKNHKLDNIVNETSDWLINQLRKKSYFTEVRGRGLMIGAQLKAGLRGGEIITKMLHQGYLMLCDGPLGNVLSFTPPFHIDKDELRRCLRNLDSVIDL